MSMEVVRVTEKQYDLGRGEIGRVARTSALNKFLPMGNLGGGPGIRCLVVLIILHRLGRPLFRLLIPHEDRLTAFYRRVKKEK